MRHPAQRLLVMICALALTATAPRPVWLEEWTSPALTHALAQGQIDTVIIATGGTENNGPHIPLGKHNAIVRATAERLAQRLGKTVVAPVIAYVPERAHAGTAGTLSLNAKTFEAALSDSIDSLAHGGFTRIVIIGDSAENQAPQARVAARADRRWHRHGVRVRHLSAYYANNGQARWLTRRGIDATAALAHGGLADRAEYAASTGTGSLTDRQLGAGLLTLKVEAAVAELTQHPAR